MPAPLDPKVAEKNARAKGWIPAVPFPGADKPWPGHCARCGKPGKPKYGNFCSPKSRQGPCRPCSGAQKKTEEDARSIMALRGLTPIPPYSDVNSPWESVCGNCGGITFPTLTSVKKAIRQGQPKCCDLCRRNGPIRPEQAEDLLRLAGGEPLVPFPGVKVPWRALCLNEWCQQTIEPLFDSIKHAGTGACRHCGGYGIRANDDAVVYLMKHEQYDAAKIGIAKVGSRRVALHKSAGWLLVAEVPMPGYAARLVERRILATWSALKLPYGVRPSVMPYAGYTETVSLGARSLMQVKQDLKDAVAAETAQLNALYPGLQESVAVLAILGLPE